MKVCCRQACVFLFVLPGSVLRFRFFAPEIIFQSSVALHSEYGQSSVLCGLGQSEEDYPECCVPCGTHGDEQLREGKCVEDDAAGEDDDAGSEGQSGEPVLDTLEELFHFFSLALEVQRWILC